MSESLTANGVSLASYAYLLTNISGIMSVPKRRGEDVTVAGRHGRIPTPNKRFDAADLVLPMWVNGALADGSIPGGSTEQLEFFKRRDELLRLFFSDPLVLEYTRPDGAAVSASCAVVDTFGFDRVGVGAEAKVSIALTVFGAFWKDSSPVTQTVTGVTGTTQALTAFVGATAPIADLTITVQGPCNNPTISHGSRYVTYNGTIASGRQLVLNTGTWTVGPGTGAAWTPDVRNVAFGPGPTWLELDPTISPFQVVFTHTGGGSASCSIAGRRAYLTA